MRKIRKVTLVGLGSMGAFFAPRLAEGIARMREAENGLPEGTGSEAGGLPEAAQAMDMHLAGFRVLAGGERKERLEPRGVTINGVNYHFPVVTPESQGDPADLVIVAVKDPGLEQALADMKHQVGEHTLILPVLNGVESEEKVAAVFGWEHVLYSYMRISIAMKDGVADFNPDGGKVYFGEKTNVPGSYSERVLAVKELFDACHIPYEIEEDMIAAIWFKFICNIGENLTCAAARIPFGAFRDNEDANSLRIAAMKEAAAIAEKKGIHIPPEKISGQGAGLARIAYGNRPSTLQDLENGRKTEVEMFAGTVMRLGRELGVPTPVNEVYYHLIRIQEAKNEGRIQYEI